MNYQTLSIDRVEGFDYTEKQYNAKILSMFIVTNRKEKITITRKNSQCSSDYDGFKYL